MKEIYYCQKFNNRENVKLIYLITPQIQHTIVLKVPFIYSSMLFNIIACLLCPWLSPVSWQCSNSQHYGSDPQKELLVFIK